MTDRVEACVYPERKSCRGCNYSYKPSLFDGGCRLAYEGGGAKSHGETQTETAAQPDAKNRELDKGAIRAENP